MSAIELVSGAIAEIEELLVTRFGTTGEGIRQKTASVENEIPAEIRTQIQFISSVHDMLVSQHGSQILNEADVVTARNQAVHWLRGHRSENHRKRGFLPNGRGKLILSAGALIVILSTLFFLSAISQNKNHGLTGNSLQLPQIR